MTLKYKVGDVVVLAENVEQNWSKTFVPGVAVKIDQLCDFNSNDEHYTVSLVSDPSDYWYIVDKEINHETTALLQMSNESGYLVQKISVENDVVSSAVSDNESKPQDNSWYENGELPPIGTACEYYADEDTWRRCEIVAHKDGMAVVWVNHAHIWTSSGAGLRPMQTDEQIAAQEREKAITYMINRFSGLSKAHAVLMYDAGYRIVETEDE